MAVKELKSCKRGLLSSKLAYTVQGIDSYDHVMYGYTPLKASYNANKSSIV